MLEPDALNAKHREPALGLCQPVPLAPPPRAASGPGGGMVIAVEEYMGRKSSTAALLGALVALAACGEEQGTCRGKPCNGPSGLPCRCGGANVAGTGADADAIELSGAGTQGSVSAAGTDTDTAAVLQVSAADADGVVMVNIGQSIDLTVQTIGPGQYDEPLLSSDALTFEESHFATLQNPGGPRQIYRFHAAKKGTVTIAIPHTGMNPTFTITFHVS